MTAAFHCIERDPKMVIGDRTVNRLLVLPTILILSPITSGPSIPLAVRVEKQFWHGEIKNGGQRVQVADLKPLHARESAAQPRLTLMEAGRQLHL